jgi:hypothetical protein
MLPTNFALSIAYIEIMVWKCLRRRPLHLFGGHLCDFMEKGREFSLAALTIRSNQDSKFTP